MNRETEMYNQTVNAMEPGDSPRLCQLLEQCHDMRIAINLGDKDEAMSGGEIDFVKAPGSSLAIILEHADGKQATAMISFKSASAIERFVGVLENIRLGLVEGGVTSLGRRV